MHSGCYTYLLNDVPTDVNESWTLEGDLAGECRIASQRTAPGIVLQVDAEMVRGRVQTFSTRWQGGADETASSHFHLLGDGLVVKWSCIGSDTEEVIELSCAELCNSQAAKSGEQPLLFPLMRIFTGPLIAQLLEGGGNATIALPDIRDPTLPEQLLRPLFSERSTRVITEENIELPAGGQELCRCCEYTGDQYSADSRFWLASDNLLARYQWQQSADMRWDVYLQRDT